MAANEFKPKVGRIGSTSGRRNQRYLNRVIQNMKRATQAGSGSKRSSFSGSRFGRGYSAGTVLATRSFQQGRRRVIVKARFTSFKRGGLGAAKAHLRYIQRDGVTLEGERGELYGVDSNKIDGKAFLERSENDPHQFRIIVAPEDGAEIENLKPFIRDLMSQAENDLGTKLDWAAVDHFNTGHPHSHIVIRGKDDKGNDLIIARDYISRGLRERACDLATLELGPETENSIYKKLALEVQAERFTHIDRSILREADEGILAITSKDGHDKNYHAHRMGRLQKLKSMGLADELKPGVWKVADRTESVLKKLGERGDIMKTMQRVLKDAGIDRGATEYAVFDASNSGNKITGKVTGKIVGIGFSNELQDQHYVVIDGTDGKLHYAEIGRLSRYDPPSKDVVVTLRGSDPSKQQGFRGKTTARIFIESHVPFNELASANGATWLDRKLLSKEPLEFRNKGFGAEANRALRLRQQWLIKEELMTEPNGQLVVRRRLLETLQRREVVRVAGKLQKELGLTYQPIASGERLKGQINKTIKLASGRYAVVQNGKEFSLVPWQQAMALRKGNGLSIDPAKGISR
ncbi:MAG: conjugal transfer protein TraI [Hyphomicrobiales bacterium]|nr:MAG: conjugal transfer protein TraI [Hyphomicrobiales bacterium]